MNRTARAILAIIFVGIITFSAITISQKLAKGLRADVTQQKLYTLSGGTKAILAKLNQPVHMKLYYTKTAAMKAPDQIRFFNNYYEFVRSLLDEYVGASGGKVKLDVIDPRPFSDDESDAIRYGLQKVPMSEEENFFFGLVVQTSFGATKSIPFFSPQRERFVEYDISYLLDSVTRRQKKTITVISSLPVMGEDASGYMAQMMRMQGQQPKGPWTIIEQLRETYDVKGASSETVDANDIKNSDMLLIIHPKDLPEQTMYAIDQFVLKGGKAIVCVDPFSVADRPGNQQEMFSHKTSSSLDPLLKAWGLNMPEGFAGDRELALAAALGPNERPQKVIGFLGLNSGCFSKDNVITSELNNVRMLFAGTLKPVKTDANSVLHYTPLLSTTNRGNIWKVENQFELMMPDASKLMNNFTDGTEPVHMGYLVTGRFKSAFPNGVNAKSKSDPNSPAKHLTGLKEATGDCAVAVFSDVDFISDLVAYDRSFFGTVATGDNAALMLNAIDDLAGSQDLISIRSRGSFTRPFSVIDSIEAEAEKGTAEEEKKINADITSFQDELNKILASTPQGKQQEVIGSSILAKKKELELKIRQAQAKLRDLKMKKRERIEQLGGRLRNLNTLPGPALILVVAVGLATYRSLKRRRYISHASDA